MRLRGKSVVVTGAASGIGRGIALRFAREGASVVVSDVHSDPIGPGNDLPTHEAIGREGGLAIYVRCDISSSDNIEELFARTVGEYGSLDVLVNNAAVIAGSTILETSEEEWDHVMNVNLRGQFLCCKHAISRMLTQHRQNDVRGRIINISSQHGMIGPPAFCAYAVSKGGVVQLTRQLAVDYAREGIIVNAVAPGRIVTGTHPGDEDTTSDAFDYSRSRTPFSRLGRVEDVAGAALFLASDDCSFVSGHNLLVDGGWMAY